MEARVSCLRHSAQGTGAASRGPRLTVSLSSESLCGRQLCRSLVCMFECFAITGVGCTRRQDHVQTGLSHLRSRSCSSVNQAEQPAASLSCCLQALMLRPPDCSPAGAGSRVCGVWALRHSERLRPNALVPIVVTMCKHDAWWSDGTLDSVTGLCGWWSLVLSPCLCVCPAATPAPHARAPLATLCYEALWRVLWSSCSCPSISLWAVSASSRPKMTGPS